ncbi:MAG: flagellar basal body-associated FliL family protein [Deltaproteobacteria bacterium]|nr:flagellar basal body-associated FliL family protein [Deltaproteobacteria bacterium]
MNDATSQTQAPDAEQLDVLPKKSPAPLIIAGLGAVALVVGIVLALRSPASAEARASEAPVHEGEAAGPVGSIVNLDSMVVNLNDAEELRYLKCSVAVELESAKSVPLIEKQTVRIRNGLLLYLSNLQLAQTVGTANKEKIQLGLKDRLSEMLGAPVVKTVYLTEFVLQ